MKYLLVFFTLFLSFAFISPPLVFAQSLEDCQETPVGADESLKVVTLKCIPQLFLNIVSAGLTFAGIVAVFFIIWGGYKLAFSGGDPEKIKGARETITFAILGLVLVFMSYFIVRFIADATGVACLTTFGFSNCGNVDGIPECPVGIRFDDENFPYETNGCVCPEGTSKEAGGGMMCQVQQAS